MLNRRHIRTKVMQVIYAHKRSEEFNLFTQEMFLKTSMESMYSLYLLLISLLIKVHEKAKDQQLKSQQKHLLTSEDLNPNKRFVQNSVLVQISKSESLKNEFERYKIQNWELDNEYVEVVYRSVVNSDIYLAYMDSNNSFNKDKQCVIDLFREIIAPNDKLYDYLEDRNLTWLDDLPVVNTAFVKLLNNLKEASHDNYFTPKLFKDSEDKEFGVELLRKTVHNIEAYTKEICLKTQNWDKDRIADIDFVLLQMAICEFHEFPSIPTKVSINEYIEIAKDYSSEKSGYFVNGVLDKLSREFLKDKKIVKVGRGLL